MGAKDQGALAPCDKSECKLVAQWSNGDETVLVDAADLGKTRERIRAFNARLARERKAGLPCPHVSAVTEAVVRQRHAPTSVPRGTAPEDAA